MESIGLSAYTWLQARLMRAQSEEEGQGAVEYAVIVAVVAVVVAAMSVGPLRGAISSAYQTMSTKVGTAINGIA